MNGSGARTNPSLNTQQQIENIYEQQDEEGEEEIV